MQNLVNNIFNKKFAENASNRNNPDENTFANGIGLKSEVVSTNLNGTGFILSEAIQYLQFTGGLYSKDADYSEGNIASLVIKNGTDYSIWQFRRNANNPQVLNNNPPVTGASITTVNGVDAYEGGTLNTDWDKLTEDYAVEATPNTVMGRDGEGASNVNMPSSIEDTTVVNNQYLQQELQTGLAAKQDKLTAGTNITIEDNVISASGNLATKAELVSYDNSNTNLEKLLGYDFPKYKKTIPNTVSIVLSNGNNNYNASIVKQSDGSYRLKCNISNFNISGGYFSLSIKNVNNLSNIYQRLSFLSQFFNIQTIYTTIDSLNYINLEASECVISSLNFSLKFALIYSDYNKSLDLIIKIDSSIQSGSYNITLNIKNRVLKPEDRNIFAYSDPFMGTQDIMDNYILSLSQNNSSIKLTGSYTLKQGAGLIIGFYSPIIENYFNVSNTTVSFQNTSGITSSSGKAIKFGFYKNSSAGTDKPLYLLFLMYQDDTDLQVGEKITFNLAPSKNSTLNPIYQNVTNVQQAIETIVNDKIPDVYDYSGIETLTNKIVKVDGVEYPVYRHVFEIPYTFLTDNAEHNIIFGNYTTRTFILKYDAYLKQVINPEKYPGQFTLVQLSYSGSEGYINTRLKSISQPRIKYKLSAIPYDGKRATSLLFIIYCYK